MSKSTIDKEAMARRKKILKMKEKNNRIKERERKAIEKKKNKYRKKIEKNKKKIKEIKKQDKPNKLKKISRPTTIPDNRLTEPKKRSILRRVMLQMKYNRGAFDYIEEEYDDLTRQEIEGYRTSSDREDKKYYKEVQAYEDAYDDVAVRKGWTAFKVGLVTVMLVSSIGLLNNTMNEIHANAPEVPVMVTLVDATEEQKDIALTDINLVKMDSEYNFENLTQEEQIDAALRIPFVENKMPEGRFENAILRFRDQNLLDEIVAEAYGEEYNSYSDGKKEDLRKLAYELLEEEKQDHVRDPVVVKNLLEKQEAERLEREANMREVEARLNGRSQNNQDLEDRDDR